MPLGLKFLHSYKKPNKIIKKDKFEHSATSSCDDVSLVKPKEAEEENPEELKSISDPNLHTCSATASNLSEVVQENQSSIKLEVEENVEPEIVLEEHKPLEHQDLPEENDDGEDIPAEMVSSFFDNNGNPMDEDDDELAENPNPENSDLILKDLEVDEPMGTNMDDDEPKYFINAATLSDEECPPSGSPTGAYASELKPMEFHPEIQSTSKAIRRVPISRSYPDIVQTTLNLNNHANDPILKCNRKQHDDGKEIRNELQNSIIQADSLEEIQIPEPKTVKAFERIDRDSVMNESVLGITNEKPPDSWAVDFNSFSLEAEIIEQQRSRERQTSTSSNSNSLAYFISIDEIESETETSNSATETCEQKKIFSMFVDIGNPKEAEVLEPPIPTVMTNSKIAQLRGRTSSPGGGHVNKYGCKNRFASPGPRINLGGESKLSTSGSSGIPKKIEKSRYDSGGNMTASSSSDQDRMTFSNRSSLHVAQYHDGSFTSSLLSSMENSAPEEAEVCHGGPCFKLGMDLLRMFQEGINTDVNISVRGRYVKAHKCILASRSQYFAALLSGNWIQKAGNTIYLDEFTYNVVQFTMYHIYSGTNEIPDSIDLVELATLTDLLGLEGLREVISQTIRAKFCHNFHRPCTTCISGVLEFFPLTLSYGMDELHRKMIKWICKHFVRIWPTKAFASLGNELTDKCLRYSVNHLSAENLLDITLGCDQLLSTMPSIRWTELIFSLVNQLSEACVQFIGENLSQVLQSQRFIIFGKGQTWNISRIENTFLEGIKLLGADEACLTHVALSRLIELGTETIDEVEWSPVFVDFLNMLRSEVEKLLLANASKAVLSKNWELLSTNTRKMICSTSFMGSDKSGHSKIQITKSSKAASQTKSGARPGSSTSGSAGRTAGPINSATITRGTTRKPKEPVAAAVVSPTVSIEQKSLVTTPTLHSSESSSKSMKVASVRPMPKPEKSPVKVPAKRSGVNSTASTSKGTRSGPQKEKSFETSSSTQASRVSSASSSVTARRGSSSRTTPMNPLTPMTPSAKVLPSFPRASGSRAFRPPSPPKDPPKKPVFLTNSEKAKAVSKPKLIIRTNRSNSITSEATSNPAHSRQSSVGSTQSTPRTPNMSQNSRFACNPTAVPASSVPVKLKTNSEKTIKPPDSPLPKARNLSTVSSRLKTTNSHISSANSEPMKRRTTNNIKTSSLMTKSSTEAKQEEPKTRTLAEIGRSNTFSKDEPTILGKLEVSQDFDYEYDYDPL